MSIKILTFIDAFNLNGIGGAARVFLETSKTLVKNGKDVDVICRSDDSIEDLEAFGAKFFTYKDIDSSQIGKVKYYRKSIIDLYDQYMRDNRPDVIIIHSSSAVFGLKLRLEKLNIPILYYFHSPWHLEYESLNKSNKEERLPFFRSIIVAILSKLRKSHELKNLKAASTIITLSKSMQSIMLKEHPSIASKNLMVNPGGANGDIFYPESDEERYKIRKSIFAGEIKDDDFILITSRRLVPRTGVDFLIQALAILKNNENLNNYLDTSVGKIEQAQPKDEPLTPLVESNKNIKLILTGSGASELELKQLVKDLNISDDVIFTGYVSEDALAKYYRASDLFVMPTKYLEGFGLSTVEAMASGLPVIGTNVGGTPEILSKISNDLIIEEVTPEAIANKIKDFVGKANIEEYRDKSIKCFNEYYTWDRHVERLMDLLEPTGTL